jgi:hypothetical protein
MWGFCLSLPTIVDGKYIGKNKEICFAIPFAVRHFPPEPEPQWIRSELFEEEFVTDLQTLAAIDELAAGLSSGLRRPVQQLVRTAAKESKFMPAGFELHFNTQSHRG